MRLDILRKIYRGHERITKCRAQARDSVWWPRISTAIESMVRSCSACTKESSKPLEPLMLSSLPEQPWQKVARDLFYLSGKNYLLVTEYYSRYTEMALLNTDFKPCNNALKVSFHTCGTPEIVFSDNRPQYQQVTGSEFHRFAQECGCKHKTSSPRYPQSNRFVKVIVGIIKKSLKKTSDSYIALQSCCATPPGNGYSLAELLMGCKLRTSLPSVSSKLEPKLVNAQQLQRWERK